MSLDDVAKRLAGILARSALDAPRLERLVPGEAPARVIAVDGSSIALAEPTDPLLAAYRAGSVGVEKGHALPAQVPTARVVLLTPRDAREAVVAELQKDGVSTAELPQLMPAQALDMLRSIEEARAAQAAVERLDEGDVLLLDGALLTRAPQLERALAGAARKRVEVVGVCKSTSIQIGSAPALVHCLLEGRALGPKATWWAPIPTPPNVRGRCFAARLSGAEERAFRFDVASGDPAVLARLAPLCGHPAYPGYPSPLAMAHNAVLLNDDARRQLLARVRDAALDAGADPRAWDAAFVDYHDVLELGA